MGRNEHWHHVEGRGKGPGTWGKTCGDNVGKGHLPAGTGDNLQRPIDQGRDRRRWEGCGLTHEPVGAKKAG